MVLATASKETQRLTLKTLEGGFVEARRLTYGEKMQRRAMTSKMKMIGSDKSKDFEGEFALVNEAADMFDFQKCVTSHNLEQVINAGTEQEQTVLLDLTNPADIKKLDPRVGEEISDWLGSLNNFEEDPDSEN